MSYESETNDKLRGKTIVDADVNGGGIRLTLSDGSVLDYNSSDGGYSSWELLDGTRVQKRKCHVCGAPTTLKKVSKSFLVGKIDLNIGGMLAYVCDNCGEVVFSNTDAKMIERTVRSVRGD